MTNAILQTDQTLTEREKENEVERVKAEAAEAASKQLADMQKKNDQLLKEKEKSYQEYVKQLTEKKKQEEDQQTPEQQRAFEHKFMVVQLHHLLCSLHF